MEDCGENEEVSEETVRPSLDEQSAVRRLGGLPLVRSVWDLVSRAYSSTKRSVPLLQGVLRVAESTVQTLAVATSISTKPLLDKLEPQISAVNEYAMMGLDKLEEKFPVLHRPTDKLVSDTVGTVYRSMSRAKEAVQEAVVGAAKDSVMLSQTTVMGGLNTVLATRMGQMVRTGVDRSLDEVGRELATLPSQGHETGAAMTSGSWCFARLGNLPFEARGQVLQQSLSQARHTHAVVQSTVTEIRSVFDQLEKSGVTLDITSYNPGKASDRMLQHWSDWQKGKGKGDSVMDLGEQSEKRALSLVHGLSGQLWSASLGLVSSVQGLPWALEAQLMGAQQAADKLHSSLGRAHSFSPELLEESRCHLTEVQKSVNGVMEYLLSNTSLNWVVGHFKIQCMDEEEGCLPVSHGDLHSLRWQGLE